MKMRWMIYPVLLVLCQIFLVQGVQAQDIPDEWNDNMGFRVVFSLALPSPGS